MRSRRPPFAAPSRGLGMRAILLGTLLAPTLTLSWPSYAHGGAIEPFLARLSADPIRKASAFVSPAFAWDREEAERGRARILIRRTEEADFTSLRPQIERVSPSVAWEGEAGDLAQVVVEWSELPAIAEIPGVSYLFRSPRPVPCRAVGSEGLDTMRVPAFHETGNRGAGSRIAILDLGFEGYERFLGNELGDDVVVRSFFRSPQGQGDIGGDDVDHGIACAEIIHDIAPEARLYLVNVESLVELQNAVDWLASEHVSVISHSVGWYFGGLNGHGPINDIADRAARNDILWVNAAGNEAERHTWMPAMDTDGNGYLELDDTGDDDLNFDHMTAGDTLHLILIWDDWPRTKGNDLDLELLDAEGTLLASTGDQSAGNPYALRQLVWDSPDGAPVVVRVRAEGSLSGTIFHVFRLGHGVMLEEHRRADRSLLAPADSRSVIAVGAVYWRDLTLDSYSSRGANGQTDILKPELCAPVGVTTAIYGREGFRGTSAAAPHVAGAAGLVASAGIRGGIYDLQWTRDELAFLLERSALPLPSIQPLAWGSVRVPARFEPSKKGGPRVAGNPAFGRVRWEAGFGEVEVVDVTGRILARCAEPFWDGREAGGRAAPAGIYWLRGTGVGGSTRLVWLGR